MLLIRVLYEGSKTYKLAAVANRLQTMQASPVLEAAQSRYAFK